MKFPIKRKITKNISIGKLNIGSSFPISIQTMLTESISDTAACLKKILELETYSCDIVRLAVRNLEELEYANQLIQASPLP